MYVQVTNNDGSTVSQPVTVQAAVVSNFGGIVPQRLKQLAQTITASPEKNLGLDNSVFGKVKGVILSSYLKGTLNTPPPASSPSPSPEPFISPQPSISPSYRQAPPPQFHPHPRHRGRHHLRAPSPKRVHAPPPCPYRSALPPRSSPTPNPNPTKSSPVVPPKLAPNISPSPQVSRGSKPRHDTSNYISAPESSSPQPSPSCKLLQPFYADINDRFSYSASFCGYNANINHK